MSCGAVTLAIVFLVITTVTARSGYLSNTPLYTFRVEQAGSNSNFLPVEMSTFTYAAERGTRLNYEVPTITKHRVRGDSAQSEHILHSYPVPPGVFYPHVLYE